MPAISHLQGIQSLPAKCLPTREIVERSTQACPLRGTCQSRSCQNTNVNCSGSRKGN
jgi:hypothetical protein